MVLARGGNLIDLGIRLHHCTVKQLLEKLSTGDRSFSFHQPVRPTIDASAAPEHKVTILETGKLQDLSLVSYLHSREIDYYTAKTWCKEVLFSVNGQQNLALGFENRAGGYELRNASLKMSSSPKDLTFIDQGSERPHVLEGFTDFLLLLTLNRRDISGNFLVLNSLSFVARSLEILKDHKSVQLYLDHDNAATKAIAPIKQSVPNVQDARGFYQGHKDLNDYLKSQRHSRGLHL